MQRLRLESKTIVLLAPHFPELALEEVEIRLWLPWYIRWCAPIRASAFTGAADCIYFIPECFRQDTHAGLALLAHELTHCTQYQRYGWWGLRARYLLAYFRLLMRTRSQAAAYYELSFEREARERADVVMRSLKKK